MIHLEPSGFNVIQLFIESEGSSLSEESIEWKILLVLPNKLFTNSNAYSEYDTPTTRCMYIVNVRTERKMFGVRFIDD